MVMVVVLVLGQTTYPPKILILSKIGMVRGSIHLSIIIQNPSWIYWSKYYSVGASYGSSFVVCDRNGKYGVVPRNTHLSSPKVDCCIDGGDFYHPVVVIINPQSIQTKIGSILRYIVKWVIDLVLLVTTEVVLVLWPPTSPLREFILEEKETMGGLFRLSVITYLPHDITME